MMSKNSFYKINPDKAEGFLFDKKMLDNLKDKFFYFLGYQKVGNLYLFKITEVYAVLIDRIIFHKNYEFLVEDPERFYECFIEVSIEQVKNSIDNTGALLSKQIFRR